MIRAVCFVACLWPAIAEAACRQALALGLDVSGSVDAREYRLQLDGLAAALGSEEVRSVLLAPGAAPVEITIYEWSGPTDQTIILPWAAITEQDALDQIIVTLRQFPRAEASPTTALGSAILTGIGLLNLRSACWTRTLDISGDGPANTGPRPQDIADAAIPADVVINALVIGSGDAATGDQRLADIKELSSYFRSYVIRGPNAFVETALGFDSYADAMKRKLLRELTSIAIGAK